MGIRVEWAPDDHLLVTGDIAGELPVPADQAEGRFFALACSDGSLIEGAYSRAGHCLFRIAREGAGIARLGDHRVLELEWLVEWITIAPIGAGLSASNPSSPLPLFPELAPSRRMVELA